MTVENRSKSMDKQLLGIDRPINTQNTQSRTGDSKESVPSDLEIKKRVTREQDQAKIAEVRASLGLEQIKEEETVRQYLQEYLNLEKDDVERILLLKAKDLPEQYQAQFQALRDERLVEVTIAVVPDDLWSKGSQSSESTAEEQLILIKQSYFEKHEDPDEFAWLCHELAHCQKFLDSQSAAAYQKDMRRFAFKDLMTKYTYPNNPVEQYAFTKQFQFLREHGKSRKEVQEMISQYYKEEDFPFFNRLLDAVYER